jgi:hypothetical protein
VEKSVKDETSIRQFLKGLYGARGPNGELAFDPEKGVIAENLPKVGESRVLNGEVSDHLLFWTCNAWIVKLAARQALPMAIARL